MQRSADREPNKRLNGFYIYIYCCSFKCSCFGSPDHMCYADAFIGALTHRTEPAPATHCSSFLFLFCFFIKSVSLFFCYCSLLFLFISVKLQHLKVDSVCILCWKHRPTINFDSHESVIHNHNKHMNVQSENAYRELQNKKNQLTKRSNKQIAKCQQYYLAV